MNEGQPAKLLDNGTKKNSSINILMMGNKQLLIVPVTFAIDGLQRDPEKNLSSESNREINDGKIIYLECDVYLISNVHDRMLPIRSICRAAVVLLHQLLYVVSFRITKA
ncbi:hypothetical protein TNCV_4675811 [Trichonephila clavipes]|nr:hypothetical protein TNCV_4675811 [Trichonephila clavipes]